MPAICLKMPKKSYSLPVLQWIHVYFGNITGVSVLEDLQLLPLGANLPVEVKNGWCTEASYLWEGPGDKFPGVYPPQHSGTCSWRRYSSEKGLESATLNRPQPLPQKKKQPIGFGEANFHHQNPSLDPKLPRYIDERNKGTRRSRCCNCQAKTTEAHGIQWPGLMNRSRQTACGVASSETQSDFTI